MTRIAAHHTQPLTQIGFNRAHLFSPEDVEAIDAAIDARRPLLLRGEPGSGKSQLAVAAAQALSWQFRGKTVDALTEPADLLWTEDAVARLAEAQLAATAGQQAEEVRQRLERRNFIKPGPLWWGFNWVDAAQQAGEQCATAPAGVVVLIDEIDKADASVPNGLLEALGAGRFPRPGATGDVEVNNWPLVIITTNEDRPLPNAFLRRCIVHHMDPPMEGMEAWLVARAQANFPDYKDSDILQQAAKATLEDRHAARQDHLYPLPGLAEYLDLLQALFAPGHQSSKDLTARMAKIRNFFLKKHRKSP